MICIAAGVAVLVVVAVLWHKGYFSSTKEGYVSSPMSSASGLVRSPVNTMYKGNGIDHFLQYRASFDDKTIPLEYSQFDPYKRVVNKNNNAPLLTGQMQAVLPNDGKLRMDMVESGQFREFTLLNNEFTPAHKQIPGNWTYDFQDAVPDDQSPLMHPIYFRYGILGHGN